jgi:DNA polymerase/3'-5' exonuclease PolX
MQAVNQIESFYQGDQALVIAGSWRREKETIGDLDILVPPALDFGACVDDFISLFNYEPMRSGELKSEGILMYKGDPLLLNLWRVPEQHNWAGSLLYATGPFDLNIMMRACAKGKGWKLNQYGLFDDEGHQRDKGDEESQIFALLGLPYLTPQQRETWQKASLENYAEDTVEVLSSDGVTRYRVTVKGDKATMCECKGFQYRSKCRHLVEAEAKVRKPW